MSNPDAPKPRRLGQCIPDKKVRDKYFLKIFLGRDSAGRRINHSEVFYGKRKDAEQRLRQIHNRHLAGEPLKQSNESFGAFLDEWLTSKKLKVAETTAKDYKSIVEFYIRPHLGNRLLRQIDSEQIEKVYEDLFAQGLSRSTVRHVHVVLAMVFKLAVIRKKLTGSPMLGVDIPKQVDSYEEPVSKAMDSEQTALFLQHAAGTRFEPLIKIALGTGFRPGELLGLKWTDLDPIKREIRIQRNIHFRGPTDWYTKTPKTPSSRRAIPITLELIEVLAAHRKKQLEQRLKAGKLWTDHGFIFCDEVGEPYKQRQLGHTVKLIIESAGLPSHYTPYSLRHTHASLLINSGERVKDVAERLGHSSVITTLTFYDHPAADAQEILSRRIEEILSAGRK
jgi:integrase